jgi:heme A synthase
MALMFGKLIPPNLFSSMINIFETPQTIVFIHRWFAFVVFIAISALYFSAHKQGNLIEITNGLNWLLGLVAFQIILGILTVVLACANCDRACTSGGCAGTVRTDDLFHSSLEGNG